MCISRYSSKGKCYDVPLGGGCGRPCSPTQVSSSFPSRRCGHVPKNSEDYKYREDAIYCVHKMSYQHKRSLDRTLSYLYHRSLSSLYPLFIYFYHCLIVWLLFLVVTIICMIADDTSYSTLCASPSVWASWRPRYSVAECGGALARRARQWFNELLGRGPVAVGLWSLQISRDPPVLSQLSHENPTQISPRRRSVPSRRSARIVSSNYEGVLPGMGNPLLDISAVVDEAFLAK